MFNSIINTAKNHLKNIPGWRTNRKIVVIQSDDWGSIRMPSKKVFESLLSKGLRVDRSIYNKFDVLEQRDDLEYLFNTLVDFKDKKGNYPIFTFNTVMGNPNFENIRESKFREYYYEDFFTSYERYNQNDCSDLWYSAIKENLVHPQFHAREHLNVSLWMDALRKNYSDTRIAFEHKFYGLNTKTPSPEQNNYLAAYWAEDKKDFFHKSSILIDGLKSFKQKFGFKSESFVACNFIYPLELEKLLSNYGITIIQTQQGHLSPDISTGKNRIRRHFTGQQNNLNQIYMVRNCTFEPTLNLDNNSVNTCINEIETAFRWKKPAIISTHRINYVGGISSNNRDNGLKNLKILLNSILNKWPEVEFMSTMKFGKFMCNNL